MIAWHKRSERCQAQLRIINLWWQYQLPPTNQDFANISTGTNINAAHCDFRDTWLQDLWSLNWDMLQIAAREFRVFGESYNSTLYKNAMASCKWFDITTNTNLVQGQLNISLMYRTHFENTTTIGGFNCFAPENPYILNNPDYWQCWVASSII